MGTRTGVPVSGGSNEREMHLTDVLGAAVRALLSKHSQRREKSSHQLCVDLSAHQLIDLNSPFFFHFKETMTLLFLPQQLRSLSLSLCSPLLSFAFLIESMRFTLAAVRQSRKSRMDRVE